jgi:hypothetical protein
MTSVADELRDEDRRALAALSPSERVALALKLGARALKLFASAQRLPLDQAQALLRQRRQLGRVPSRCMSAEDDGAA